MSTAGAVATLTITEGAGAADTAVGSFTVALATSATGIRDAAANLSSFAAAAPTDGAKPVLVTMTMQDTNANGKVDRVTAVFSETLAAYTAGNAPWTLANVPSGGTLASVAVATTTATLTINEGAGAANTAVGQLHGRARDERDRDPRRRRATSRASPRRRPRTGRRRCARRW